MLSSQRCARALPSHKQRKLECGALGDLPRSERLCPPARRLDPLVKTEVAAVVRGGQRVPGPSLRPSGRSVCASWFAEGVGTVGRKGLRRPGAQTVPWPG